MTQHEYIFIAVSIILGLAITRLLHNAAMLIRVKDQISFHWSSAIWAFSIMLYILQLWWVGWGLRVVEEWQFIDFIILVFGCSCLYGAAEMALSEPGEGTLDMLSESQQFGRLSALSMLLYFFVGPYLNIFLYNYSVLPSLIVPSIGILLMIFVISLPSQFKLWSALFLIYSVNILVLTV
ncbi:hypothetical protein N9E70_00530 [bacterium]|jgi:hypothetical protein|nr:hypothetical protein [Gammaproteobacteria bacterium]MBT3696039.1 hypothetical protein [Gammaproteobacteria bacterium]MBT5680551.1 hypothetical protein [Gammaproteobacteria bacterium]MBT6024572.1 hypothetical protein [Gammaproteobacteria bacterium]MDA9999149.1 hypothetical protein [bacterium]